MNSPPSLRGLADASASVDAVLSRFEQAWRQGSPPRIDEFLPTSNGHGDEVQALLQELVLIDLNYRWRLADPQAAGWIDWASASTGIVSLARRILEDYVKQFPLLGPPDRLPVEMIAEEYRVRQLWGDRPGVEAYRSRFPLHAPRLTEVLAAIDAELAADRPIPVATPVTEETPFPARAEPAERIIGPYVVLEPLGQGGTGQVFKARHQRLDRIVALKVIRKELLSDPEVVSRFYREMRLVSQLSSPHVVHAFDAGPITAAGEEGVQGHFLVMEYVEGIDLGRLVKKTGPLPARQAAEYIRQAALGLQHIYEHQLVHRDIKPGNLFLCGDLIKILDLGLARWRPATMDQTEISPSAETSSSSLTPAGSVMMGTPDYLAPEQALDFHAADIRADLYSLGCTFYYLLTGQPPFPGGTLAQKLLNHQNAPAPPVNTLRRDVPPAIARIVHRLLAKRPEDRYPTPADLVTKLDVVTGQHGKVTERPTRPAWLRSRSMRRVLLASAPIAAVLAVLALASFRGNEPSVQTAPNVSRPPQPPPKPPPTYSFWDDSAKPARPAAPDTTAVELGIRFHCDVPGVVTAIRYYKGPTNAGTHVAHLWDTAGTLLATASFTNETTSGWQRASFPSPVPITAHAIYTASYHTDTGNYATDSHYFSSKGIDRGPLHAPADRSGGGNGVFRQGKTAFPDQTFEAQNYWVDVVFEVRTPVPVSRKSAGDRSEPSGNTR
jgi:serine/threonine protein kinase